MAATDYSVLLEKARCYLCLPVSMADALKIGALAQLFDPMAAPDMQTLMDEAKCYMCFGELTSAEMLVLALLRRWLLDLDSEADVTAQSLYDYTQCYACLGSATPFQLLELGLLGKIEEASQGGET